MTNEMSLRIHLTQIMAEAVEAHWETIEPYMKEIAVDMVRTRPNYQLADAVSAATDAALKQAIAHHTADFQPVVDHIARAQVVANLRRRLQARGLSTDILDAMERNDETK